MSIENPNPGEGAEKKASHVSKKVLGLWPYLLGIGVLICALALNPTQYLHNPSTNQRAKPANQPTIAFHLPEQSSPLASGRVPVIVYQLIGEQILNKLRPQDAILTLTEYNEAVKRAGVILRDDIKIQLPTGLNYPPDVPVEWLENPIYVTADGYAYKRKVQQTNAYYIKHITTRLTEEYATQVMPPFVGCIQNINSLRKEPDAGARAFVHALYGEDYIVSLAMVIKNSQKEEQNKKKSKTRSMLRKPVPVDIIAPKEQSRIDDAVNALWRTEFTDQEFLVLKDLILHNEWREPLRNDLMFEDMSAVLHAYMEATHLGYRLGFLHLQTQFFLNGKIQLALAQAAKK